MEGVKEREKDGERNLKGKAGVINPPALLAKESPPWDSPTLCAGPTHPSPRKGLSPAWPCYSWKQPHLDLPGPVVSGVPPTSRRTLPLPMTHREGTVNHSITQPRSCCLVPAALYFPSRGNLGSVFVILLHPPTVPPPPTHTQRLAATYTEANTNLFSNSLFT